MKKKHLTQNCRSEFNSNDSKINKTNNISSKLQKENIQKKSEEIIRIIQQTF